MSVAHPLGDIAAMQPHEKLVRDGIPDLIRASGREPSVRIADPGEIVALLRRKLSEEVQEFLDADASDAALELADVLEVVDALGQALGLTPQQLQALRADKATSRGTFADRVVLRQPV